MRVSGKLVEEVPHMRKRQLATHLADMPILPMVKSNYRREGCCLCTDNDMKKNLVKYKKNMTQKVHGECTEKKLQSAINSIGEQSALLLMAVKDCIVNKKSQAEIARKYGLPRSRVQ